MEIFEYNFESTALTSGPKYDFPDINSRI